MSQADYSYATGVVRSLENRVLNPNDIERMVDAPDLAAAFKVFNDTDYFDNIQDLKPSEFLQALDKDLIQVRKRIQEMAPDDEVVKFIFMRNDFRNMKLLYKAHFTSKQVDEYVSSLGFEDPDKLKQAILGDSQIGLEPYCERALTYVKKRIEDESKGATPALIGRWFDRKYFKEYQDQAKRLHSEFLQEFVKLQLEIANLKTFIRAKILGLPNDYIVSETLYIEKSPEERGITLELVKEVADLPLDEALGKINGYLHKHTQAVLTRFINERPPLEQLEKDLENVEIDFLREAKYIDNGPELVVAYYYAKRNAIRNTRLIMTGKANQMPALEIKKLIRELY